MTGTDQHVLLGFFFLFIISALTSYYALQKGRNPVIWFVISLLIGFLAPVILYFLPSVTDQDNPPNEMPGKGEIPAYSGQLQVVSSEELPSSEKLWYYLDENHRQYGPVSIIALKNLFDTAKLGLHSYVWSEGMEKWEQVGDLPELKESLHKPGPLL